MVIKDELIEDMSNVIRELANKASFLEDLIGVVNSTKVQGSPLDMAGRDLSSMGGLVKWFGQIVAEMMTWTGYPMDHIEMLDEAYRRMVDMLENERLERLEMKERRS